MHHCAIPGQFSLFRLGWYGPRKCERRGRGLGESNTIEKKVGGGGGGGL